MQPKDNSTNPPNPRSTPKPNNPPRQDFSRSAESISRYRVRSQPARGMDGLRHAPTAQTQPNPLAPVTPAPSPQPFKLPQPSPGFKPPAPQPTKPVSPPVPVSPKVTNPNPKFDFGKPPTPVQSTPTPRPSPIPTPATPTQPTTQTSPIDSLDFNMENDMESMRKDDLLGMTGSRIIPKKQRLPRGVFAIAAVSAIGFGLSFFDGSTLGFIYTIAMILDLLLIIGLFLRLEIARKLLLWLSITLAVLNVILGGAFFMLVNRANQFEQQFVAEAKRLNEINPQKSTQDQAKLDAMQKEVEDATKQLGNLANLFYIKVGVTAVAHTCIAIYLSRPKVKESFRKELK